MPGASLASVRCQLCERSPEPLSLDMMKTFISVIQSQMELFKNTFKISNMFQNIYLNSVRAFSYYNILFKLHFSLFYFMFKININENKPFI